MSQSAEYHLEKSLLFEVGRGNREAFREIYTLYNRLVTLYVSRRIADYSQAEETISDIWVECWRCAHRYRGESSPKAWILGISKNLVLMYYRKNSSLPIMLDIEGISSIADSSYNPEIFSINKESYKNLLNIIERLPSKIYETVAFAWVYELSYKEIAEILEIPEGTVKSRIHKARKIIISEYGKIKI